MKLPMLQYELRGVRANSVPPLHSFRGRPLLPPGSPPARRAVLVMFVAVTAGKISSILSPVQSEHGCPLPAERSPPAESTEVPVAPATSTRKQIRHLTMGGYLSIFSMFAYHTFSKNHPTRIDLIARPLQSVRIFHVARH